MHQDEHVCGDDKSAAVATVVAAVEQARSRGPSEGAGEQVERRSLRPSLLVSSTFHSPILVVFHVSDFVHQLFLCRDAVLLHERKSDS